MKLLVAPVHLDALTLPFDKVVRNALVDYTRLPYTDGEHDFNSDTPFVGEAIENPPFQDLNLLLQSGTHLHWSMPRGLHKTVGFPFVKKTDLDVLRTTLPETLSLPWPTVRQRLWEEALLASGWVKPLGNERGSVMDQSEVDRTQFDQGINTLRDDLGLPADGMDELVRELFELLGQPVGARFPGVPDLWLVQRKRAGITEKTWLVESAYASLTQSDAQGNVAAVAVPFHDHDPTNKTQPYRYLGRQIAADTQWHSALAQGNDYLTEVTSVGYNPQEGTKGHAESTFSAYYPHCSSVFGLYDSEVKAADADLSYEVMGIHLDPENDYLSLFLKDFANRYPADDEYYTRLAEAVEQEFNWDLSGSNAIDSASKEPGQVVLYGKAQPALPDSPQTNQVKVAVGHTGTEALSAYVSSLLPGDKAKNEELLEAVQQAAQMHNRTLDIPHKLREARHAKGFSSFAGGTLWTVVTHNAAQGSASDLNDGAAQITLPETLADELYRTNRLQTEYDQAQAAIVSLRRQLFSDWHRYMIAAYPPVDNTTVFFDADEMVRFIREGSIRDLENKQSETGQVFLAHDEQGSLQAVRFEGSTDCLAARLAAQLEAHLAALLVYNQTPGPEGQTPIAAGKQLVLRATPAPRFYRANDPVVLFAENSDSNPHPALRNHRFPIPGASGLQPAYLVDSPLTDAGDFSLAEANQLLDLAATFFQQQDQTGHSGANWHPFMLEWKVEYYPMHPGSNHITADRQYATDYLDQHYVLPETDPDFRMTSGATAMNEAFLFSGQTIVTPEACVRLDQSVDAFLRDHGDAQTESTRTTLTQARAELDKLYVLSQSLGGFQDALQMQIQARQMAVADPIGFSDYQNFARAEVAPLVDRFNLTAPNPLGDFNPWRTGQLEMVHLRLIGTFGLAIDLQSPDLVASETMAASNTVKRVNLMPRLSQPARINFRFLSATSREEEMNAHPASSPICGWMLPNHLDQSLEFYDSEGYALGAITRNADNPWVPAPDAEISTTFDAIPNAGLRQVARFVMDRQRASIEANGNTDNSFLDHFLLALDKAQEAVDPENFQDHPDLAILMGEPIAVVRTRLNLELEGLPVTDQGWTQMGHEIEGGAKEHDGFTRVQIPVRVGEHQQLNDGLLGYWQEDQDGNLGADYISSEAGANPDPHIKTYHPGSDPINLSMSLSDDPVCLTMLVDPKGVLHAVSGILPVKSIALPKDQYQDALKRIGVTFLTAPVLSPATQLEISLPNEPGFEWTWYENQGGTHWRRISGTALVDRFQLQTAFPDQPQLWEDLVGRGWIKPFKRNEHQGILTDKVHRAFPPDPTTDPHPFPVELGKRIDAFFDTQVQRIAPFDLHAALDRPPVIREGYLRFAATSSSSENN